MKAKGAVLMEADDIASNAAAVKDIFDALATQGRMKIWLCNQIDCNLGQLRAYRLGISVMPTSKQRTARRALGIGA